MQFRIEKLTYPDPTMIGTIRTVPENYYVATIKPDYNLEFQGLEAMTRNIDQNMVRQWFQSQVQRGSKPKRKWAPSQVWAACKRAGIPVDERSTVVEHYQETGELPFQTFPALRLIESWPEQPRESPGNPGDLQSIIQKENEYFKRYGRPVESDFSINDIQREKIKAYYQQHPQMYVGEINRTERVGSPLEQYVSQKVYNFQYDFIIPQHDAELQNLLTDREISPYTGTKEDAERLDKIYVRVKTIGGLYLYWA